VSTDLAARFFVLLFTDYDLVAVDRVTMAIQKDGRPVVFSGSTLSEIALQIADYRAQR
jgi:hypothetical protein